MYSNNNNWKNVNEYLITTWRVPTTSISGLSQHLCACAARLHTLNNQLLYYNQPGRWWFEGGGAHTILCCGPSRELTADVESCSLSHSAPVTRLRPSDYQVNNTLLSLFQQERQYVDSDKNSNTNTQFIIYPLL